MINLKHYQENKTSSVTIIKMISIYVLKEKYLLEKLKTKKLIVLPIELKPGIVLLVP